MTTLLEKARAKRPIRRRDFTHNLDHKQLTELIVAYLRNEVSYGQVATATGKDGMGVYSLTVMALREAIRRGEITISRKR